MEKSTLDEKIEIRISREDGAAIRRVSSRLALSQAEITRRAIRLGLGELGNADLPGAAVKFEAPSGAHGG
jgi:hypothetical protein